jgi:hypothetical protein
MSSLLGALESGTRIISGRAVSLRQPGGGLHRLVARFFCLALFAHMAPLLQWRLHTSRHGPGGVTVNAKSDGANTGPLHYRVWEGRF